MKQRLNVKFVDFSDDFCDEYNFFLKLMKKYYEVELSDEPDLLFYSNFGIEHLKYKCKKIYYTGENISPNYFFCDFSFSFNDTDERNFFLPHFVEYNYFFDVKDGKYNEDILRYRKCKKDKFCNFIASNYKAKERINFVKRLMNYKKVDCIGPVLYNMEPKKSIGKFDEQQGGYIDWRKDKLETIKSYKFTIAFENEQSYNYVTEKIYQPFVVGSIPIYWGAPNIDKFFNSKCFVNVNKFNSFDEVIDEINKIDNDENHYNTYFEENPILFKIDEKDIIHRIDQIIFTTKKSVGSKYHLFHIILFYIYTFKFLVYKKIKRIKNFFLG